MTTQPQPPAKVGKYEVERILGRGAMGVVYLARDPMIGRQVAVKTIHLPAGLESEKVHEFRTRFLREAQAAGRLNHPNLVTIYEADDGSSGGPPFIAMEYIQGATWSARVKRGEKAHADQLLPQVMEIAEALAYAHKQDVVHRDIKPANIITTPDGRAKLMDFGIARVPTSELTQEGQFLGTPAYMSPEQILGKPVDGRSDLFSLGTVVFEMLTGLKPFPGEEVHAVTHKILQSPPEPLPEKTPEIPAQVAWILNCLLAKKPEDRYTHAGELAEDIRAYLHGADPPHAGQGAAAESTQVGAPSGVAFAPAAQAEPKPASPNATFAGAPEPNQAPVAAPPAKPDPQLPPSRTPLFAGLAVVVLLLAGAGGGGLWWWTHRSAPGGEESVEAQPVAAPVGSPETPKADPPPAPPQDPGRGTPPRATEPPPSPKPKPSQPAPPATTTVPATGTSRLDFTFTAGVLKGEYWLKVDGKTVAHGIIDRKFTLKSGEWSGTASVPAGSRTVRFELKTEIQDLVKSHEERVEFSPGAGRSLDVKLHKVRKELEFAWR